MEKTRSYPEDLWFNTEDSAFNPTLILARILIEKRSLPITISNLAFEQLGRDKVGPSRRVEGLVAIRVSAERARAALNQISNTPEHTALSRAFFTPPGLEPPSDGDCQWDEETKRRVQASHWLNKAKYYKERLHAPKSETQEFNNKARELLGKLKPLTLPDIRSLLEKVVDRELPAIPTGA